jgi:hypothetical protein
VPYEYLVTLNCSPRSWVHTSQLLASAWSLCNSSACCRVPIIRHSLPAYIGLRQQHRFSTAEDTLGSFFLNIFVGVVGKLISALRLDRQVRMVLAHNVIPKIGTLPGVLRQLREELRALPSSLTISSGYVSIRFLLDQISRGHRGDSYPSWGMPSLHFEKPYKNDPDNLVVSTSTLSVSQT